MLGLDTSGSSLRFLWLVLLPSASRYGVSDIFLQLAEGKVEVISFDLLRPLYPSVLGSVLLPWRGYK